MKLTAEYIAPLYRRSVVNPGIGGGGEHITLPFGNHVIRVNEIHIGLGRHVLEHGAGPVFFSVFSRCYTVPADLRHLGLCAASAWQGLHRAGDQAQPLMAAELVAFPHQQLHAETDAHERPSRIGERGQRGNQFEPVQRRHSVAKGAHAREDDGASGGNFLGRVNDIRGKSRLAAGLTDAEKIAQAIVNDDNARGERRCFSDGSQSRLPSEDL